MNIDYYASVGYALELLAQSEYHRRFPLGDYFRVEILPALWCGQARFYLTPEGVPTALVTWARLTTEAQSDVHATGRALDRDEWTCGDRLFFNDWITPYDNIREVLHDMTHNIFSNEIATSLRRNPDGSVRRVNRWTGVNLRKPATDPVVDMKTINLAKEVAPDTPQFQSVDEYPALMLLQENWRMIRDEFQHTALETLSIQRDGKTHEEVFAEVRSHCQQGGPYGWLKGWGRQAHQWTQLGLVVEDQEVPFLQGAMPGTTALLRTMQGVNVAAFLKMAPGTFLETHTHPELTEKGLLQFHLTLDAADTNNFAYLNVDGEFRQHVPGEAFVFDGARPHFAVNASACERVILYLEFDPVLARSHCHTGKKVDYSASVQAQGKRHVPA